MFLDVWIKPIAILMDIRNLRRKHHIEYMDMIHTEIFSDQPNKQKVLMLYKLRYGVSSLSFEQVRGVWDNEQMSQYTPFLRLFPRVFTYDTAQGCLIFHPEYDPQRLAYKDRFIYTYSFVTLALLSWLYFMFDLSNTTEQITWAIYCIVMVGVTVYFNYISIKLGEGKTLVERGAEGVG